MFTVSTEIVKMLLATEGKKTVITIIEKPIVRTKFKRLQETGMGLEIILYSIMIKKKNFKINLTDAHVFMVMDMISSRCSRTFLPC